MRFSLGDPPKFHINHLIEIPATQSDGGASTRSIYVDTEVYVVGRNCIQGAISACW